MNRRLRKHPQQHPSELDRDDTRRSRRLPYGFIWLVLAVLVLVLVIVYDRRSINDAEAHITAGHQFETKGLYVEALNEYEQALKNRRLGRKAKSGVAVSMADIYFQQMEDYPSANSYYVRARQISSSVLNSQEVQDRAKLAAQRARGAGVFKPRPTDKDGVSTRTIVQRVELLQKPQADSRGPVVATYNGGEVRAGELLRVLEKRPEFLKPDFRENPQKLRDFLKGILHDDLAYQAAVSVGVNKDPDVSQRLYDYQKSLVTQRYLVDRRQQAMVVANDEVEDYYRDHVSDYVKPGRITVSLIKSDSETSATELLQKLRDGARFQDVASSFSTQMESARKGGDIGTIMEKATTIKGVGEAPNVVKALFTLPLYSVSEVTPVEDAYYIFKITSIVPTRNRTLDEARGEIENILRGHALDQERNGLEKQLNDAFEPDIDQEGLKRFWDYASKQNSLPDGRSSGTKATSKATTSTVSSSTSGTKAARRTH